MQQNDFTRAAAWLALWACVGCGPDLPRGNLDVSQVDTVEKLFEFSLQRYCDQMFECALPNDDSLAIANARTFMCPGLYKARVAGLRCWPVLQPRHYQL